MKFNGPSPQTIQGNAKTWFNTLNLLTEVSTDGPVAVEDKLQLTGVSVFIGDSNLYIEPGAQITGVDPSNAFVVTDMDGGLVQEVQALLSTFFPVGNTGSYSPVSVQTEQTADIEVRVFQDVLGGGGITIPEIDHCVNKTWAVWDWSFATTIQVDSVLWNIADEGSLFDRTRSALGYGLDGFWYGDNESAASGTDPYKQGRIEYIPGGGHFAVGDINSPMAIPAMLTIEADLMVYLEGPYNGTDMNTELNGSGQLPLTQPYHTAPWNYTGTESVPSIPNPDIVDWVLVEFRDAVDAASATEATTIQQQAAFLLNDGTIVDMDGYSNIQFTTTISQQLYVVIRHRNHIDIISSSPLTDAGGLYTYNFTSSIDKVYGGAAGYKDLASGSFGMAGGDADANGTVENADKTAWTNVSGQAGYLNEDQNMDGQIDNKDKNDVWVANDNIKSSQVPD
ncbi:MAG: hypothetical protein R2764_22405 [Bacteroidales bacterium]